MQIIATDTVLRPITACMPMGSVIGMYMRVCRCLSSLVLKALKDSDSDFSIGKWVRETPIKAAVRSPWHRSHPDGDDTTDTGNEFQLLTTLLLKQCCRASAFRHLA